MEIDFRETIDLIKQGKEEGFNKLLNIVFSSHRAKHLSIKTIIQP